MWGFKSPLAHVRTAPLVGTKPWFGPKWFGGWGWAPASWEGWVALGVGTGALVAVALADGPWWASTGVAAGLVAVAAGKGSSPGGRRERADFERRRPAR